MNTRGFVGNLPALIGVVLFILVFVAVIPTVGTETSKVTNTTAGFTGVNVTGASNAMASLTTLIFVAIGIVSVIGFFRGGE